MHWLYDRFERKKVKLTGRERRGKRKFKERGCSDYLLLHTKPL